MDTNPVGELNNICSRLQIDLSFDYAYEDDSKTHSCVASMDVPSELGLDMTTTCSGVGRTKKEAKKEASLRLLDAVRATGADKAKEQLPMTAAILSAFSSQKLKTDPVFRCYLEMTMRASEGWIPMGLVCSSRVMQNWWKSQELPNHCSSSVMAKHVVLELQSETEIELDIKDNGWLVRSREPVTFKKFENEDASSCTTTEWMAVLLPSDDSCAPHSVKIDSQKGLIQSISECLQLDWKQLGIVHAIGSSVPRIVFLSQAMAEQAVPITDALNDMDEMPVPLSLHPMKVPSLWCDATGNSPKHNRASWLCGQEIHGDVLLTLSRPSGDGGNWVRMMWRHYSLSMFRYQVQSMIPENAYTMGLSVPLLGRMPVEYKSTTAWQGNPPFYLLSVYLQRTGRHLDLSDRFTEDEETEQTMRICGTGLTVTAMRSTAESALQNASLRMIRLLQTSDAMMWSMDSLLWNNASWKMKERIILDVGRRYTDPIIEGWEVKIQYRLLIWNSELGGWFLLEVNDACIIQVSDTSALDKAVQGLHVKGSAKALFDGSLVGWDKSGDVHLSEEQFCLFVKVLSISGFQDQLKLFNPPLSEQRYAQVRQQLEKHHCHTILDMGCGEGRFLEVLASSPHLFSCLHGVDISERALQRAKKRMMDMDIDTTPTISIFHGNTLNGHLMSWTTKMDAVVMIEVVEHLDEDPLSHLGSAVLGQIRPRVFISTTPNWEYNCILYHIGGAPETGVQGRDGTPLRCSDHRFEWNRSEFQSWALALAKQFGYNVEFFGIGSVTTESNVYCELDIKESSLGYATQMAVFIRDKSDVNLNPIVASSSAAALHLVWTNETET